MVGWLVRAAELGTLGGFFYYLLVGAFVGDTVTRVR